MGRPIPGLLCYAALDFHLPIQFDEGSTIIISLEGALGPGAAACVFTQQIFFFF